MTFVSWEADSARRTLLPLALFGAFVCIAIPAFAAMSPDLQKEVSQLESTGDLAGARSLLERNAAAPGDSSAAQAFAEFLERHDDPGCRDAYLKWATQETDPAKRKLALREVVLFDFMNGKDADLQSDLSKYREAGGTDFTLPSRRPGSAAFSTITIPGPLSSFARMAALSPDLAPETLLPALARNVVTNGYEASSNESLEPTEYLRLVIRYIGQARELEAMAGPNRKIVIPTCDSPQTGDLLKVIGYRMRGSCGGDIVLETVNPTRAFITVDSGFPLTQLEQDLRANHRFEMPYAPTSIPVLYNAEYWLDALGRGRQSNFIDAFLSDPSLCRLYLGLSHLDRSAAEALRKRASASKLRIYAHVLDFFGGMFDVRNGAAVVPGSPKVWASLVGAAPEGPGAFFVKLIETDDGWLASYFDALSRINGPTAAYLTQPDRMKRFYRALRGKITSPGPARPVFRSSTDLMLLTTSLRIQPDGQPHIPGNLEVWRSLFIKHPHGKYDGKLTRSAKSWRNNDDLIEALFALSRKTVENEPLKIFLALNDIDRDRDKPMSPKLASRLIDDYRAYGSQYLLFADVPTLSESSIEHYLDVCDATSKIHGTLLKADTLGTLQALVDLWRILSRQDKIPAADRDATFARLIQPFAQIKQDTELFDAGRSGVEVLLAAAGTSSGSSPQAELTDLLVGKLQPSDRSLPYSPAASFYRIFDAQRLIPLDSLFAIAAHIGKPGINPTTIKNIDDQMSRLEETESLRGSLSSPERNAFALGYWSERHIRQERKLDLGSLLKNTDKKYDRGVLAPFLRDSLVGILYAYYAPPGAQLLLVNPLFVRSHDFIGAQGAPAEWRATEVAGTGWPESAGGRLMGSLISLPYAIAQSEQNFLTPKREQALIWADLVPQIIADVTINRWRNITAAQLRWVSLHIQRGRTLLAAAALDQKSIEPRVIDSFRRFAPPERVQWLEDELRTDDFAHMEAQIPTSVLYALAIDPALKDVSPGVASVEISEMTAEQNPQLSPQAIAQSFGTPKPTLTHSYRPGLLYLRTFPALMGYSSRILAETWESNNLFFAALADKAGVPVNELDDYVPEWNRLAIENIYATHLEDWPALLRSLHTVAGNVLERSNNRVAMNTSRY